MARFGTMVYSMVGLQIIYCGQMVSGKNGIWNGSYFDKSTNPYGPEYQTSDAKLFMDYISSSPLSQFGTQSNPAIHINNILNNTYTYLNVLPITLRHTIGFFQCFNFIISG